MNFMNIDLGHFMYWMMWMRFMVIWIVWKALNCKNVINAPHFWKMMNEWVCEDYLNLNYVWKDFEIVHCFDMIYVLNENELKC
jgi:hypothetical protein